MPTLTVLHDCATVQLHDGSRVLIDAADYPSVSAHHWRRDTPPNSTGTYAVMQESRKLAAGRTRRHTRLHRFLLAPPSTMSVDHVNGDGLDNRRANLRLCTKSQNAQNTRRVKGRSAFKGVVWDCVRSKWSARLKVGERRLMLGNFATEAEAAAAYDRAAREHFGEFACTNADLGLI